MKATLLFLSVFLSTSLFGQFTAIPDPNFEQALIDLGHDDVIDGQVLTSNISGVDSLDVSFYSISDLTGIEDFTSLSGLGCFYNNLTSLDVSNNSQLSALACFANGISDLELSQNTALTMLVCSANMLTNLDLTQNISLRYLVCDYNELTSLDLSNNILLDTVYCYNNNLNCINVANGNNTNIMDFSAENNPNLTCIEVDDAAWAAANWTSIDSQTSFSEDCNNDCSVGINELSTSKNLIQILDLMGRETAFKPNTPLIYVYDDGSTEKVFTIE